MKLSRGDAVTYVALVVSAALQALEPLRKEAAVPPDAHPILSSAAWAYVPLALLILVGLIWLARQITHFLKDSPKSPNLPTVDSPPAADAAAASPQPYVREARVNAGMPTSSPEIFPNIVVCFDRNGRDAEVCVDFSYFTGGLWTQRRRLLLKKVPSFRREEYVPITILTRDTDADGLVWRWGDASIKYPNKVAGILGSNRCYRCCIVFIFADGTEEYAYFIAETPANKEAMPAVVGKHMLDFVEQWEKA
jgi:hypothetical protein